MNLLYDLIMKIIENIPWLVLAYSLHIISKIQPSKLILEAKDFIRELPTS